MMNIIIGKDNNYNIKDICNEIKNNVDKKEKTEINIDLLEYIKIEEFIDELIENLIWYISLSEIEDFVSIKNHNNIFLGRLNEYRKNA